MPQITVPDMVFFKIGYYLPRLTRVWCLLRRHRPVIQDHQPERFVNNWSPMLEKKCDRCGIHWVRNKKDHEKAKR